MSISSIKRNILNIDNIDYNQLLNRTPILIDCEKPKKYLNNYKILITGGCGSIGSEIIRQLLTIGIDNLIIYDNRECGIFDLKNEINDKFEKNNVKFYLGDVLDVNRLEQIFINESPNIIYHCAAYKHVPIMEANPNESIKVNILGTNIVANLSIKYNVVKFIMISTDKAVNPSNIMGATKRISEIYVNYLNKNNETEFITTRFGNVLGSSGSVIPTLVKKINENKSIDITHPEIIRYFMTIPEAARLVIYASTIGKRGEILMFDMGKPVKIIDLANNIIKQYTDGNIQIKITGLRPGEKLYEELLCNGENTLPTENKNIMILKHNDMIDYELFIDNYQHLLDNHYKLNYDDIRRIMKILVPEYNYIKI